MRRKTYLSPEQQWERSIELMKATRGCGDRWYTSDIDDEANEWKNPLPPELLGAHLHLGQIAYPHRWFLQGDLVFIRVNNGMAERYPVWAVSSKGYSVRGAYLKFQSWWEVEETFLRRSAGPLRFVELPDDLVRKAPDDPAVRQFVATLRAGGAAPG